MKPFWKPRAPSLGFSKDLLNDPRNFKFSTSSSQNNFLIIDIIYQKIHKFENNLMNTGYEIEIWL